MVRTNVDYSRESIYVKHRSTEFRKVQFGSCNRIIREVKKDDICGVAMIELQKATERERTYVCREQTRG